MRTFLLTYLLLVAQVAFSVQIKIDYSRDTSSMFSVSTQEGQRARATLEAAADNLSSLLNDELDFISKPNNFFGIFSTYQWDYDLQFIDPASGNVEEITNTIINEDEILIFVGALGFATDHLALGSAGGSSIETNDGTNLYTKSEKDQIDAVTNQLMNSLLSRGKETGFARWGGSMIFNSNQSWHYDHTTAVNPDEFDLYSAAAHELFHILGFGAAQEWHTQRNQSVFFGTESVDEYGDPVPLHPADNGHWQEGTTSPVYDSNFFMLQEALMDPSISRGTRKQITRLDIAGLRDIGWSVSNPVPEPTSLLLSSLAAVGLLAGTRCGQR